MVIHVFHFLIQFTGDMFPVCKSEMLLHMYVYKCGALVMTYLMAPSGRAGHGILPGSLQPHHEGSSCGSRVVVDAHPGPPHPLADHPVTK